MNGNDFPDALNPVVVRELRQSVRSRAVIVMLMASLLFLVLASGGFGIVQGAVSFASGEVQAMGRGMFMFLQGVLALVTFTGVPLYAAVRLAYERNGALSDMLYITTLKPGALIRGKLGAALVVLMLLVSSSLPFLAFTFLLRGIDIPTMLVSLSILVLVVGLLTQAAIVLACLPMSRAFQILLALFVVLPGLFVVWSTVAFGLTDSLVREGVGSQIGTKEFWAGAGSVLAVGASISLALHAVAVALVSPAPSNRAFALRIRLTIAWVLALTVPAAWSIHEGDADPLVYTGMTLLGGLAVVFSVVCGSPSELSERVQAQLPGSLLKRILLFPWTNGFGPGLIWSAGLAAATYLGIMVATPLIEGPAILPNQWAAFEVGLGLLALGLAYGLTARLLRRGLFPRAVPPYLTWAISLILFALLSVVHAAVLLATRVQPGRPHRDPMVYFGNPIALGDSDHRSYYVLFAAVWAGVMLALHVPALIREARGFRRPGGR